jgi:hypothetical protein
MAPANPLDAFPYPGSAPAVHGVAVDPSDTEGLGFTTRALYVGAGGTLKVTFAGDASPVELTGLLAGVVYPFAVTQVWQTGTTASDIIALS